MIYFFIIICILNIFACCLMGIDKLKAKKDWYRISEKTLILSAIPFSSFGFFLGMKIFRHKTKKFKFQLIAYLFMIIHVSIIGYAILHLDELKSFIS